MDDIAKAVRCRAASKFIFIDKERARCFAKREAMTASHRHDWVKIATIFSKSVASDSVAAECRSNQAPPLVPSSSKEEDTETDL